MDRLFKNLFQFDAPSSLGTKIQLRIFELCTIYFALSYTWEWALYVPRLSDVVLPLGLANYINVEIFFGDLATVNAILISLFCLIPFFAKKMRWLYAPAFILFHLQHVVRFSQGEIPHSANMVGFALMALGLSEIFFKNDIKKSLAFAFGFTIFFFGLGYTSAALSKLVATGITWPSGEHLWLWMGEKSIDILSKTGEFQFNWLQQMAFEHWWMATSILAFGLITELIGFLIWWKPLRPYITLLLIAMHVGIDLTMNIFFFTFTVQLIIIGFPWNKLINKVSHSFQDLSLPEAVKRYVLY